MVACGLAFEARVAAVMVGNDDYQRFAGKGTYRVDKLRQATVGIGKGIRRRVGVAAGVGHLEGFVAARGLNHAESGGAGGFAGFVEDTGEHIVVVGAPFAGTFGQGEVAVAHDVAEAAVHQVGLHVGEIDVAAVVVGRRPSGLFQRGGQRGQPLGLADEFHQAGGGLAGDGAQDCRQGAVGAETGGVEVVEQYAGAGNRIQPYGDGLPALRG